MGILVRNSFKVLVIFLCAIFLCMTEARLKKVRNATVKSKLLEIDLKLAKCGNIVLREVTLTQLQNALQHNQISSVQLVKCYIRRIRKMDPYLHSILEINPDALEIAQKLDNSRSNSPGKVFGPMYGIPLVIKDNIGTDDKMETTAGSVALLGIKPKHDSGVVKLLRNAGAIILGKANLDEFASGRSSVSPNGWSGRGNGTSNAYVLSGDPKGSSSGSAVAVAANLIPVALGTETRSSIVWPSGVAAIVGLKTTLDRVPISGLIPLVPGQDVIGPMARTVQDAAILFSVISRSEFTDPCFANTMLLSQCAKKKFRVGVLRDPDWVKVTRQASADQLPILNGILISLSKIGITVVDPILESNGTRGLVSSATAVLVDNFGFKHGLNEYLRTQVKTNVVFSGSKLIKRIETLADIIEYNKKNPEQYGQDGLIETQGTTGIKNTTFVAERMRNYQGAKLYLNYLFKKYSLDAMVVPTNWDPTMPAVAGYPYITVPAGFSKNIPFGICFMGQPNSDEKLLILAYKVEQLLKARRTSLFLP